MMQMGCISWQALCSISCDMYPQHYSYCEAVTCTKLTLVTHTSLKCYDQQKTTRARITTELVSYLPECAPPVNFYYEGGTCMKLTLLRHTSPMCVLSKIFDAG